VRGGFLTGLLAVAMLAGGAAGAEGKKAEGKKEGPIPGAPSKDATTHTSSQYIHHVFMYDPNPDDAARIKPTDEAPMPFSTRNTCGHCHEYAQVSSGWHFSAFGGSVPAGRAGEPWVTWNRRAGVQLPVSDRGWAGTYKSAEIGLSPWQFIQKFGRHFPGGGIAEAGADKDKDPKARWMVSGKLEVNCLACHTTDPASDMTFWFPQLAQQNFMWATTAVSGFAYVKGATKGLPDTWDPFAPPEEYAKRAPSVKYDLARFDPLGRILMPLTRKMPAERCNFCHSTAVVGAQRWRDDDDIHMARGMKCTLCHRNGLDHKIVRGYPGESPDTATLTCQGCHSGANGDQGGRLTAPVPVHRGFPPFHFVKLTCTACHSGPQPGAQTVRMQTSRLHAMEITGAHRGDKMPPFVQAPVFVENEAGQIEAARLMWPAFWGRAKDGKVTPLLAEIVMDAAKDVLEAEPATGDAEEKEKAQAKGLSQETITKVLQILAKDAAAGAPVYVGGGMLYKLDAGGKLTSSDDAAADAYTWPLGHNVRPAKQALGAGGCTDCHAKDSPFFYGKVAVDTFTDEAVATRPMYAFMNADPARLTAWNLSFATRSLFVWMCIGCTLAVLAILAHYGLRALGAASGVCRGFLQGR
jgi:hypothetical protein